MANDKKPAPYNLANAIRDAHLGSVHQTCLMLVLASRVHREPNASNVFECYAWQDNLVAETGMSASTLKRAALGLEKAGLLRRQVAYMQPTYFFLLFDVIEEKANKNRAKARAAKAEAEAKRRMLLDVEPFPDVLVSEDESHLSDADLARDVGDPATVASQLVRHLFEWVGPSLIANTEKLDTATKAMQRLVDGGHEETAIRRVIDWARRHGHWRDKIVEATHPCNYFVGSYRSMSNQMTEESAKHGAKQQTVSSTLALFMQTNAEQNDARDSV